MEIIDCIVKHVIYQNSENGFSVWACEDKDSREKLRITGTLPKVRNGMEFHLEGYRKYDKKYGNQFCVVKYEEILPNTANGIEKYLSSGIIKGVGPGIARKIVSMFGDKTLDIIENNPEKLCEVPGIGKKLIEKIKIRDENKETLIFLYECGVNQSLALKICNTYGNKTVETIQRDPYSLIRDIQGVGFKTADMIADKIGFGREKYERLSEGLLYVLASFSEQGHCYAVYDQLIRKSGAVLGVDYSLLEAVLEKLITKQDVVCIKPSDENQQAAIFLPRLYSDELGTKKQLDRISKGICRIKFHPGFSYESIFQYDPDQITAIQTAMYNKIMILTGGPGTGKTTTIRGIIDVYKAEGGKVLLATPTGRSTKRLSELTGMEAKTIHRLLEYKPFYGYQRSNECKLEGDILIVDESSMVDITLMHSLLKAIPDNMSIILVGDANQLPSVGPGNVLHDLIESKKFPVVNLTNVHRQAQTSRIVTNAHLINNGQMPDISNGKDTDFFFIDKKNPDEVIETIVDLVANRLPKHYNIPSSSIQVLTPMKDKIVGAINLNKKLQSVLNPQGDGLKRGEYIFKLHDRVMQIKNNYDKDVFNGDIGEIISINEKEEKLTVDFDSRIVEYKYHELNELVLSYATTIHKSQGSEYPFVVMPFDMSNEVMLQRNLLYTAVTRAKKVLVIVGSKEALFHAVQNNRVTARNTMLEKEIISTSNQ